MHQILGLQEQEIEEKGRGSEGWKANLPVRKRELRNQHCKNQNVRERGLAPSIDKHERLKKRERHQRGEEDEPVGAERSERLVSERGGVGRVSSII